MRHWARSTVLPLVSAAALVLASGATLGTATATSAQVRFSTPAPSQTEGIAGAPSPTLLVRVVHARALPPPVPPTYVPEPTETAPITGPPRTTGVVALRLRNNGR